MANENKKSIDPLKHCMEADAENFTSGCGIKIRKAIAPFYRMLLETQTKGKIILEFQQHPHLNKGKSSILQSTHHHPLLDPSENYIYTSTHYFSEDIITPLSKIHNGLYTLMGSTNQIECNPLMYAAWLRGIVYVDRLNSKSRRESVVKMTKLLNQGIDVLLYPEGGWNNTENLLCQEFFAGPYLLAQQTGKKVVPISQFFKEETNEIFIRFDDPIDLTKYDKEEAIKILRDRTATMMYEQIEQHSVPMSRAEYLGDLHLGHMKDRLSEYAKQDWSRDTWAEELTRYSNRNHPRPDEVRNTLRKVDFTKNLTFFAPLLRAIAEDERYDLKKYMRENFEYTAAKKEKVKKRTRN